MRKKKYHNDSKYKVNRSEIFIFQGHSLNKKKMQVCLNPGFENIFFREVDRRQTPRKIFIFPGSEGEPWNSRVTKKKKKKKQLVDAL